MTEDTIALRTLLEKGSDATFLREMIGFAAQRLLELEAETLCGIGHGYALPSAACLPQNAALCIVPNFRSGVRLPVSSMRERGMLLRRCAGFGVLVGGTRGPASSSRW